MKTDTVKLVFFSPTGTTQAVLGGIVRGLRPSNVKRIDITTPEARKQPLLTSEDELLVVGIPVYMGRVPGLLSEWLNAIEASQTPAVCVVVYGNRVYDNALLELKDIIKSRGCIPIAGAAFIGEHSFSTSKTPASVGRPHEADLNHAEELGRQIRAKLRAISVLSRASEVSVPGTRPYGGITELWDVDFIAVDDRCVQCGLCAEGCPVGAIDPENSALIDQVKCITCCACIKSCPENAKTRKSGPVEDAANRVTTLYKEPKQPECFL
jgi:ferredoxin